MTIPEALNTALEHHHARRFAQAETIYHQILRVQPNNADVLHLLGLLGREAGRHDAAVPLIQRAIDASPNQAAFHGSLGLVLSEQRRWKESIAAYRRAIDLQPNLAGAHNNLGAVLLATGQSDEAISSFQEALRLDPRQADALYNLANIYKERGQFEEAIATYHQALLLRPQWPQALNNLALAYRDLGDTDRQIDCLNQALAMAPEYLEAINNLSDAFCQTRAYEKAMVAARRALSLHINLPEAHNNLGNALCGLNRFDEAINAYRNAIALQPEYAEAHNNLANAYHGQGNIDQAICLYQTALALRGDYPSAHWNLGLNLLMQGKFAEGWPHYEWRMKMPARVTGRRDFAGPLWDGADLDGKTILLHTEQAFGDTLQFFRYAQAAARRGGKVMLACQSELANLLKVQECIGEIVPLEDSAPNPPTPPYDLQFPLVSLAGLLQTTLGTIPAYAPYLTADGEKSAAWASRLSAAGERRKIGLVWAGRAVPDPQRSISLKQLMPLTTVPGVWLCSLQTGEPASQLIDQPPGMEVAQWTEDLKDFSDTAAVIANLDLVITVDTAVAHLAGAMGKPVWVLLKNVPDWRWMQERDDSPWYHTMRLFRQPSAGDWTTPIEQIVEALQA